MCLLKRLAFTSLAFVALSLCGSGTGLVGIAARARRRRKV